MQRKLLTALLVAAGAAAIYQSGRSLWWMELFQLPKPVASSASPTSRMSLEADAVVLEVRLGSSRYLPGQRQVVPLKILLTGRDRSNQPVRRLPLNIALVIDRSGSMEEEGRMEQVRRTVDLLVEKLQPEDRVALISYSTGVTVHRSSREPLDRQILRELANALHPSGGTNLFAGLEAGCQEVQASLGPGVNRILLFSDGLANIGVRDPRDVFQKLQGCLDSGVTITSVGVGADFNEDLMVDIAERARGNFYFIEKPEEMAPSIARELEELGSVVAQSSVLELELPRGVRLAKVYGYQHEVRDGSVRIPLKDIVAGERRKLLVELELEPSSQVDPFHAVVRPILRYQNTERQPRRLEATEALALARASTEAEVRQSEDTEVTEEVVYTRNSLAVEEASRLVAAGRKAEARTQIQQALANTNSTRGQNKVARQRAELEQSLQWVDNDDLKERKVAAKRLKAKSRDYAKQ